MQLDSAQLPVNSAQRPRLPALAARIGVSIALVLVVHTFWPALVDLRQSAAAIGGELLSHLPHGFQAPLRAWGRIILSPALGLVVVIVALGETWLPAIREQRLVSRGAVHDFTAWLLFEGLLRAALDAGYVALLFVALEATSAPLQLPYVHDAPPIVRVIIAIVAADLVLWCHHLLMHKVGFLWAFHAVHHSQRELNLFTNLRFHIGEVLIARTIRYAPLYFLGLEVELAVWVPVAIESYERVYHANLRTGFGPLKYLLVTPQSHRIHHSLEPRHADRNFGILFSFWDRLFGTHCPEYDAYPATGLRDEGFPSEQSQSDYSVFATYFAQFLYPFWRILRGGGPPNS